MGGSAITVLRVLDGNSGYDEYSLRCNSCGATWRENVSRWAIKNTWKPVKCQCGAGRSARSLWKEYYDQVCRSRRC